MLYADVSIGLAGCVNAIFDANGMLELLVFGGSVTLCEPIFIGVELLQDEKDDITFGADVFRQRDVIGTAGLMKRSLVLRP